VFILRRLWLHRWLGKVSTSDLAVSRSPCGNQVLEKSMTSGTTSSAAGHTDVQAANVHRNALTPLAQPGSLQELLRLLGVQVSERTAESGVPVSVWLVHEGAALLHEGMRSPALYVVRSGSLKCLKTLEDGYEQVLSFAQPGELLGFEALHRGIQPCSAVALEETTVYALSANQLPTLLRESPVLDRALWLGMSQQVARAAETAEMMAAVASDVRLARFILWLSTRMSEAGQSSRRLRLRMGRRDIASLLGVAHETVSRSFTMLADSGAIRVDNREVEILDADALRLRARSTRGLSGDTLVKSRVAAGAAQRQAPAAASTSSAASKAAVPGAWWASVHSLQSS
jgi:CRP/FNR family transcriptional regulator